MQMHGPRSWHELGPFSLIGPDAWNAAPVGRYDRPTVYVSTATGVLLDTPAIQLYYAVDKEVQESAEIGPIPASALRPKID